MPLPHWLTGVFAFLIGRLNAKNPPSIHLFGPLMSAKTDTWMPLFIGDYLADTRHLTTLEHGAYLLLLMTYWRIKGPLPDDDIKLARMAGLSLKQWKAIRPTIIEFFRAGEGQLVSTRSQAELDNANRRSEVARSNVMKRYETPSTVVDDLKPFRSYQTPTKPLLARASSPSPSQKEEDKSLSHPSDARPPEAADDMADAVEEWNAMAHECGLPKIQSMTKARKSSLKLRLVECGGIEGWRAAMAKIRGSPFLIGAGGKSWRADFDFVLQAKSFTKLMEGAYDPPSNRGGKAQLADRFAALSEHIESLSGRA